ncbi:hypothetical protein P1P75_25560 [Streptomyces sp. ID05-39B]|uniref:hypothetical protein n=1 Tax=Streptomyces sp. ID05-39B TaxID=3028664 RepID=UPI0029BBE8E7|nr:hypothetical protein [Streptomyces sp. ID05-39B]MDX3529687.1 hypothetical protein [Streptomyces sp. ID05-39B]
MYFCLFPLRRQNPRLAGAEPALETALAAASRGRWEPAAQLFRDTGPDWERRALYAHRLGHLAARESDKWLRSWQAARPDDPDQALVQARARVHLAWKLRGRMLARYTSQKRFAGFHHELLHSREDIARAATLNPEDPTPLIDEIWRALGLGYSNDEMRVLWAEITARAPHHFEAHCSALQYWCAKWRGSRTLARDFAESAASKAPTGSLMTALPLIAWFENHAGEVSVESYRRPEMRALVDAVLMDVAAAEGHPRLPEVRHLLAYFLVKQARYRAALEQFRLVDGYVDALPWRYQLFTRLSYRVARTKAARGALLERLGR